jgi:hypothetical protein
MKKDIAGEAETGHGGGIIRNSSRLGEANASIVVYRAKREIVDDDCCRCLVPF